MAAKKRTTKAAEQAQRMRECSFLESTERRSTLRNPAILPQPPTKSSKCRQKTDNSQEMQVCALFCLNFRSCKLFNLNSLESSRNRGEARRQGARQKDARRERSSFELTYSLPVSYPPPRHLFSSDHT